MVLAQFGPGQVMSEKDKFCEMIYNVTIWANIEILDISRKYSRDESDKNIFLLEIKISQTKEREL